MKSDSKSRLEELAVIDMKFLHGSNDAPVIAILYQDAKALRHIKTYQLRLREKELAEGPWQYPNCEQTSSLLIPVPAPAGVLRGTGCFGVFFFFF